MLGLFTLQFGRFPTYLVYSTSDGLHDLVHAFTVAYWRDSRHMNILIELSTQVGLYMDEWTI